MSYTVVNVPQRSPEWHAVRCGRLTGSRAAAMLARGPHGTEAITRRHYRAQLARERFTGEPEDAALITSEMRRGIEREPAALAAYAYECGATITQPGFLASTTDIAGCSPDALVVGGGIVEVKAPNTATHCRYLQEGRLPPEHRAQVRHNLWISGEPWCDFVSFDDRVAPTWRLFVVRVTAVECDLVAYAHAARTFLDEVAREHRRYERLLVPARPPRQLLVVR